MGSRFDDKNPRQPREVTPDLNGDVEIFSWVIDAIRPLIGEQIFDNLRNESLRPHSEQFLLDKVYSDFPEVLERSTDPEERQDNTSKRKVL